MEEMDGPAVAAETLRRLAREAGFELAGVAPAAPLAEHRYYSQWVEAGFAGEMAYLTGRRAALREDPRILLPSARSVLCVGKLYNASVPYSSAFTSDEVGWISRYAWGDDYHVILRAGLEKLVAALRSEAGVDFEYRICVDTAPLLERALARRAGLGWIGKNSCLINQHAGSWFFLGEVLLSLPSEPSAPPPDRCGTCTRCIDACPTSAMVRVSGPGGPGWTVDSRLCISYLTIELRNEIPEPLRPQTGFHIFGCDICQDVCPWNRRAAVSLEPAFAPALNAPPLERLAALTEQEFRDVFRNTPVWRAKYRGFLRNVAVAIGNSGNPALRRPLVNLTAHPDTLVAGHATSALRRLDETLAATTPVQ